MNGIDRILDKLNDKQLEAVKATEGYVRVIAGAGSGKTKALTSRYAYIVEGLGVNSANVLCVTFTNKAAQEMKNRVRKLISHTASLNFITTYHGFCVRVLREDIHKIQYPNTFVIMDVEDQKTILRQVYSELNITQKEFTFKQTLRHISHQKTDLSYLGYILENEKQEPKNELDKIFYRYLFKQQKNFALDFDDLMNFTVHILNTYNDILEKWQKRLLYIQVDEAQDSSDKQFGLIKLLANHHKNLFIVGDPDQTIYEWRGARPEVLVDFDKEFPTCNSIILNQNYRSTPQILNIANQVIKKNEVRVDKDLFTQNPNGLEAIYFHAKSDLEESIYIANEIKALKEKDSARLSEITILFRAHHLSRNIEQALIKENIPYVVFGGIRFFERKEVKDTLSYLRLIEFQDDMSFLRVINYPKRGLGKKFIEDLSRKSIELGLSLFETLTKCINEKPFNKKGAIEFLEQINLYRKDAKTMIVSDFVKNVLDNTGITKELRTDGEQERLENIQELVNSIIALEKDKDETFELNEYLQEIALYTNKDVLEEDTGKVNLMTIHTAKGLEYPYVFLCGFTDGILPSAMAIKERRKRALEEERRLTYVAITRAEKRFYMTEAEGYNYSTEEQKYPSRFLFEIEENLYIKKGEINDLYLQEAKNHMEYENMKLEDVVIYAENSIVIHPIFGNGRIREVNKTKQEYTIFFVNDNIERPIRFEYRLLKATKDENVINQVKKVELKAKQEVERKAEEEAELKAEQEAERKAKEKAELKAKQEAERKAKEKAELKAKQEAERNAKEEANLKAKQEAERKTKEEAERNTKTSKDFDFKKQVRSKIDPSSGRKEVQKETGFLSMIKRKLFGK